MNEVAPTPEAVAEVLRSAVAEDGAGVSRERGELAVMLIGWFISEALILAVAVARSSLAGREALTIAVASGAVGAMIARIHSSASPAGGPRSARPSEDESPRIFDA